jgi:hypothetical protein
MTTRTSSALLLALLPVLLNPSACTASPIDEIPIPTNAQNVHRQSTEESKSKEISYKVQATYPQGALTDELFDKLKLQGWSKCSGYQMGWNSYVDASRGVGHERTVFQNISYWSKGDALLMFAMLYYGGVTQSGAPVSAPGNSDQFVAVTEDHDPAVKTTLKLACRS